MQNSDPAQKARDKKSPEKIVKFVLMEAAIEFAIIIALPLLAFIFLGRWLDTKFNHHFFVLIGLFVALALSSLMIWRKIKDYQKLLK